jgi:hypothetical protein
MEIILSWIFLFFVLGSIVWGTYKYGISPMPTSKKVKEALFNTLPKQVDGAIYELGAGWGSLAFPLADKYPNHHVIAYEAALIPYLFCHIRLLFFSRPNLEIYRSDFFQESLKGAGLIVCYLYPDAMRKLQKKFKDELQPGTWIVSHTFALPHWSPENVVKVNDLYQTPIYFYKL